MKQEMVYRRGIPLLLCAASAHLVVASGAFAAEVPTWAPTGHDGADCPSTSAAIISGGAGR